MEPTLARSLDDIFDEEVRRQAEQIVPASFRIFSSPGAAVRENPPKPTS